MTEKQKSKYWAVMHNKIKVKDGTFNECWDFFVALVGDQPLSQLIKEGYKISRIK